MQQSTPGVGTGLQLRPTTNGSLSYEDVFLNSGNFALRINNSPIRLSMVRCQSERTVYGGLQASGNISVGEWRDNVLDGAPWPRP